MSIVITVVVIAVAAAIVFVLVVLLRVARVTSLMEEIRVAGEPTSAADLEPPDVPDDQNAFLLYQRAAAMLVDTPEDVLDALKRLKNTPPSMWTQGDIELARSHVRDNADAVRVARRGARLAGYTSDVDWSKGVEMRFPYLRDARELTRQLVYNARIDIADGRLGEATDTCSDALRIASHTGTEPTLLAHLVEVACRTIATDCLKQIAGACQSPADLAYLMQSLDETLIQPRTRAALAGERAQGLSIFEDLLSGKYTPSVKPTERERGFLNFMFLKDKLTFLELMRESMRLADRPYFEIRDEADRLEPRLEHVPKGCMVTAICMPVATRAFLIDARARMESDVVRAAAAAKTYRARRGAYPEDLSDLVPEILPEVPVDEFDGKPLRYERRGEGFVVYSIGRNLVDDGGVEAEDRDEGDIVYEE